MCSITSYVQRRYIACSWNRYSRRASEQTRTIKRNDSNKCCFALVDCSTHECEEHRVAYFRKHFPSRLSSRCCRDGKNENVNENIAGEQVLQTPCHRKLLKAIKTRCFHHIFVSKRQTRSGIGHCWQRHEKSVFEWLLVH